MVKLICLYLDSDEETLALLERIFVELFSRCPLEPTDQAVHTHLYAITRHRAAPWGRQCNKVISLEEYRIRREGNPRAGLGTASKALEGGCPERDGEPEGAKPRSLLEGACPELYPELRDVVALHGLIGLSLSEIAGVLELPLQTVAVVWERGRVLAGPQNLRTLEAELSARVLRLHVPYLAAERILRSCQGGGNVAPPADSQPGIGVTERHPVDDFGPGQGMRGLVSRLAMWSLICVFALGLLALSKEVLEHLGR